MSEPTSQSRLSIHERVICRKPAFDGRTGNVIDVMADGIVGVRLVDGPLIVDSEDYFEKTDD